MMRIFMTSVKQFIENLRSKYTSGKVECRDLLSCLFYSFEAHWVSSRFYNITNNVSVFKQHVQTKTAHVK